MPEMPKKIKKKNNCFIFTYAHCLFYINRLINQNAEIEYSAIIALKMLTNAMFPSRIIKPLKHLKIKRIGNTLKQTKYGASNYAIYYTQEGRELPLEVVDKINDKYLCLTLKPYAYNKKTYNPFNLVLIGENDAKLIITTQVLYEYHKIQSTLIK